MAKKLAPSLTPGGGEARLRSKSCAKIYADGNPSCTGILLKWRETSDIRLGSHKSEAIAERKPISVSSSTLSVPTCTSPLPPGKAATFLIGRLILSPPGASFGSTVSDILFMRALRSVAATTSVGLGIIFNGARRAISFASTIVILRVVKITTTSVNTDEKTKADLKGIILYPLIPRGVICLIFQKE